MFAPCVSPTLNRIDLHSIVARNEYWKATQEKTEQIDHSARRIHHWDIVEHHIDTFLGQVQTVTRSKSKLHKRKIYRTRKIVKNCFELLLKSRRFDHFNSALVDNYGSSTEDIDKWVFYDNYIIVCDAIVSPYIAKWFFLCFGNKVFSFYCKKVYLICFLETTNKRMT